MPEIIRCVEKLHDLMLPTLAICFGFTLDPINTQKLLETCK